MELLSSPSFSSYCSFTYTLSASTSKQSSPSFITISNPTTHFSSGLKLTAERLQQSNFTLKAVVGDTTAVPNDSTADHESVHEQTDPRANPETCDDSGDPKMDRICDKLIDVFMVDKPNPIDWRRLIAFSKEWDTIRPHFFDRCRNRADKEDDPGMKHKLLRLGRKLKEVVVMAAEELIEVKFRLADGTDIGPSKYSSVTTVGSLKEKIVSQWPKDKENGPKSINDLKLINAGKILENNKTLAESRSPVSEIPGGAITMLVVVRPPTADKNSEKLQDGERKKSGCSCTIL